MPGIRARNRARRGVAVRRNREAGQSILLVALALTVLLGMAGLGIDMGYLRHVKTRLQSAADAAAIAGAGNVPLGLSSLTTAGQNAATANGFTLTAAGACSPTAGQIAINNPPCYLAKTTDPHNGDSNYVEAVLTATTPTLFARVLGISSVNLTARAEAQYDARANCVFATDQTNKWAFQDSGNTFISSCGIIVESNDSRAMKCTGSVTFNVPFIGIDGGTTACPAFLTPPVYANMGASVRPNPLDPLAYLTAPTVGSCGTTVSSPYTGFPGIGSGRNNTGLQISGSVTLNPGVYCGGIEFKAGSNVTLNAGTYILAASTASNGTSLGLTIDDGATVTGTSGVTFYNTQGGQSGSAGAVTLACPSSGNINLVAPTSGSYKGILFYQDPLDIADAQIEGQTTPPSILQGAFYFPGDITNSTAHPQVTLSYSNSGAQYTIMVAKQVFLPNPSNQCGGATVFNSNYSSLSGGSPIKSKTGTLVE